MHERSEQWNLSEVVKERCLKMLGHILRMAEKRLPKTSLEWTPNGGKRERGKPPGEEQYIKTCETWG